MLISKRIFYPGRRRLPGANIFDDRADFHRRHSIFKGRLAGVRTVTPVYDRTLDLLVCLTGKQLQAVQCRAYAATAVFTTPDGTSGVEYPLP